MYVNSSHIGNKITTRTARPDDFNFIMATWLRSLYYGDTWYSDIDKNVFFNEYPTYITQLLLRHPPLLAVLIDDPDVIVGYSVASTDTLHFVYVKKAWRKMGVAKLLVETGSIENVTHLTKIAKKLLSKYGWKFNPFIR